MQKNMVDLLCCPTCKNDLDLHIEKESDGEIITGFLTCHSCNCTYTIKEGIPNLLPQK
ncbi:MAG: methytransferase partner Trm112 [Thermoplasmatota archaeon]